MPLAISNCNTGPILNPYQPHTLPNWRFHRYIFCMTIDQIILFSLFGAVFAMLLWGKFRYDIVAFTALMIGVTLGVVPTDDAFSGFGHPATIIVALVLVVSAGLVRSGAVYLITRTLVDASRSLGSHIAIMGAIGGLLSAFMNNVAALALLMPVDIQTARKAGRAPHHRHCRLDLRRPHRMAPNPHARRLKQQGKHRPLHRLFGRTNRPRKKQTDRQTRLGTL